MSPATRVVNPATEQVIAEVPVRGVEETDEAVARAHEAGPAWRAVSPADRARLMRRFAAQVEEHAEDLAQLETANVGKPLAESRDEVGMVAEVLYFYAGAVDKHRGATVPVAGGVDMTFHEPLGVVGAIVPWNFPVAITSWKVGPALATGNTIVVKPAEITPLTAVRLAELGLEAGLPEGVLQVVTGKGSVVGTRLVEHPDVAKIAFTGSTEVGREVMARASGTIKRVTLELGGKSASVVFADADLAKAAAVAPGGMFANAGQDCCARSRILVERSVFDEFVDLLADAVRAWTVGDPTDPATKMGPLVTAAHRGVVAGFLEEGMGAAGGPVSAHTAGAVPDGPGFWFPPTVVAPADPGWRMASEEIFGPIVAVIPFDDEADAVRLANDTPYGLSGSIWTRDGARSLRMARAVQAGNLSVNSNSSVRVQTSFGGMKQSGFGRELGLEALDSYSEVKNVFVSTVD
jgi:acyl-CoA reductase-like NAD-dependent aldehyde dehydrogenase